MTATVTLPGRGAGRATIACSRAAARAAIVSVGVGAGAPRARVARRWRRRRRQRIAVDDAQQRPRRSSAASASSVLPPARLVRPHRLAREDDEVARARRRHVEHAQRLGRLPPLARLATRAATPSSARTLRAPALVAQLEPEALLGVVDDRRSGRERSSAPHAGTNTTGNSSPLAWCTVITRTTSSRSSATCASAACASPPGAAARRSQLANARRSPPCASNSRAFSTSRIEVGHALLAVGRRGQHRHQVAVVDDGLRARRRPRGDRPTRRSSRKRARKRSSPSRSAGASDAGSAVAASSRMRVRSSPASDSRATVSSETPTIGERNSATSDSRSSGSSITDSAQARSRTSCAAKKPRPRTTKYGMRARAQRVEVVVEVREAAQQHRASSPRRRPPARSSAMRRAMARASRSRHVGARPDGDGDELGARRRPARRCGTARRSSLRRLVAVERAREQRVGQRRAAPAPSAATATSSSSPPPRAITSSAARANTATSAPRNS